MADYRSFFEDAFDVQEVGGQLDIQADEYLQNQDLTRDERNKIETKFIDEVYGTTDAMSDTWMKRNEDGLIAAGTWHDEGAMDATYGLDLRRIVGEEDLKVGTVEHYEWLTRGEVDWANYESDNAYRKAFDTLRNNKKGAFDDFGNPSSINFLTDDEHSIEGKVNFIRAAGVIIGKTEEEGSDEKDDPESWWNKWDNQYDPKYHHTDDPGGTYKAGDVIDPTKLNPYVPSDLFDPASAEIQSRIVDPNGNPMTIRQDISVADAAGSARDTSRAAREAGIKIREVNVKRPSNVPTSWGPIK